MKLNTSIALCTYNGEKYLQEQLDSLAKQTRLPDELVVCDDGSTDRTIEFLKTFAQTAPFHVRIEQNTANLGFVRNFEKCSRLCSGDVIFFCDQDDIWLPEKIERFVEIFETNPDVGMVLCDAQLIDSNGQKLKSIYSQGIGNIHRLAAIARKNSAQFVCQTSVSSWAGMSMAFRNNCQEILYPFPETNAHDAWVLQTIGAISSIFIITQPLVLYRIHGGNQLGEENDTIAKQKKSAQSDKTVQMYRSISMNLSCIVERLQAQQRFPVKDSTLKLYQSKAAHCLIRYKIRTKQVNKWLYILKETLNGNYFRFGNGLLSIGMDLLS